MSYQPGNGGILFFWWDMEPVYMHGQNKNPWRGKTPVCDPDPRLIRQGSVGTASLLLFSFCKKAPGFTSLKKVLDLKIAISDRSQA